MRLFHRSLLAGFLFALPVTSTLAEPHLRIGPVEPDDYDVFVVKSRVHFRRGFDETGYAQTVIVVDAPGDWFGTTRLNALDYRFAPIDQLYPFGVPERTFSESE